MADEIKTLLTEDFGVEFRPDQELFEQLCERINYLMAFEMESFLSMLYRLDISERKVRRAMDPANAEPPNVALARLIIDRQKARMETKRKYRQEPLSDWMDF